MVIAPPQSLGRSEIFRLVKELEVEFIAHIGALSEKLSGFLFPLTVLRREPHCQRGDPFFCSVFNELPRFWVQN
jgi:hypothetical protein